MKWARGPASQQRPVAAMAQTIFCGMPTSRSIARATGIAFVVYDAAIDPCKPQRRASPGASGQAIKEEQLELYCQPKPNTRSARRTSVEALVRRQHPEYGLIMPAQLIPLIEPTELTQLLTARMLECAMRQCYE